MISLRERITIQAPVQVLDAYQQPRDTFPAGTFVSGLRNIPAKFQHMPTTTQGTEVHRGDQVQAEVFAKFTVRTPRVAILPTYQVLHVSGGNKAYGIVSVRPAEGQFEGGFQYTDILVKALANV